MKNKIKLSTIKPNPNNPRLVKDDKFKKLCNSIESFGDKMFPLRPMVIDEEGVILGGNMRYKALKYLGYKEIPNEWVKQANDLTEEEKSEFIIKDNVGFGDWEWDVLANEWNADLLNEWGLDIPDFEEPELLEAEEDNYEEPEQMQIDVVEGDLIEIGEHRLLCGDSTNSDDVARLMNREKADLVFTDPPYGVSYQSNMRTKTDKFEVLKNDDVFITEWIDNLPLFSNGFVFVWTSWKVLNKWIDFCKEIGELSNIIIWNKGGGGIGDLQKTFLTDYEVALVYHRGAKIIGKRIGSVWSIGKDNASKYLHPTQKPIGLAAMAIENILIKNKVCLDLFLGSGSTMVAAHQLNRRCYGMELDPKYCQVIIDRMHKLDPNLEIKINGEVYEPKTEETPF